MSDGFLILAFIFGGLLLTFVAAFLAVEVRVWLGRRHGWDGYFVPYGMANDPDMDWHMRGDDE